MAEHEEELERAARRQPAEPPHYQVQKVREALAHDHRVGELELQVTVRGGKVMIAGTVTTAEVRDAVTQVVREVLPDAEVLNHTTVASFPAPEGAEPL
jgi:osmotically-inducible protein OsmY